MAYKKRGKIGAPLKLDAALQKQFVGYIAEGQYFETACALCKITYPTFRKWMIKGAAEETGIYHEFMVAVQEAEAVSERDAVLYWKQFFNQDYKAVRDFMDRRFRNKWGRKDVMEISGPDGGPIQTQNQNLNVDLSKLSYDELEQLSIILKKTEPDVKQITQ